MRYYQLSYCGIIESAWQRPTLTKGNPSLPSALRSLTSVFGMGTGVTFLPSSPHNFNQENVVLSKLDKLKIIFRSETLLHRLKNLVKSSTD